MARIKSNKETLLPITDWFQADQYIREVGEILMKVTAAEHSAADSVKDIKLELEGKVNQLQERSAYIVGSLEALSRTEP